MTRAGAGLLVAVVLIAVAAPWLAPNPPDRQFNTYFYAPPTSLHFGAGDGPYFYPLRIVSRLERRFEEDRARHVPLRWFSGGVLVSADPDHGVPLLLLGASAARSRTRRSMSAITSRGSGPGSGTNGPRRTATGPGLLGGSMTLR